MEDEGIMALPEGQATPTDAAPELTSADTYDAVLTGLRNNDPEQSTAVTDAVQEAIGELNLSPQEMDAVLNVLEYMSQNPREYAKLRQSLIDRELMDPDDLPETYDAEFLGAAIMVLNEAKRAQSQNAEAVTQMAPEVEGLGPLPMAEGGLADMARLLASQGRNGDTMLAHITPAEARLLKSRGGAGSYNPYTGLPEFFLKKLFKSVKKAVKSALKNPIVRLVATVALAYFIGPTAAQVVGTIAPAASAATAAAASTALTNVAASAATSALAGEKINGKNLLINAATSYFGAGGGIGGFTPGTDIATKFGLDPASVLGRGVSTGVTGAGIGLLAGMSPEEALRMGATQGLTAAGTQAFQNWRAGQAQPGTAQVNRAAGELPPADYTAPPPPPTEGELFAQGYMPDEITKTPTTAPAATQVAGAGGTPAVGSATQTPPGKTFTERLGQFVKEPGFGTFTDAFLINPNAKEGSLASFAPAALTTLGIGALTGGFKEQPVDQSPLYDRSFTGAEFIRKNPGMFSGNLGRVEGMPAPFNPIVPTPNYARPPVTAAPTVIPRGITRSPTGVVQPYNVAGLYGVPELAAPVEQPVYMATGGPVNDSTSADYWFKVFVDNNPGIDPAVLRRQAEDRAQLFRDQAARQAASTPPPSTTVAATTMPSSNVSGNFGGSASTTPYNPAVPTMPERTAVRRARAQMMAPVEPYTPRKGTPMMPRYNKMGMYGMPDLAMSQPQAEVGGNTDFYNRQNSQFQVGGNTDFYNRQNQQPMFMNQGGQPTHFPRKTGQINGPGTGTSDSIPAMLSDGEFVFTAKAVRNAGGGSRRKGAKRMYALMKKLEGGPVKKGDA